MRGLWSRCLRRRLTAPGLFGPSVAAPFTFSGTLTANAITGSYAGWYSGDPPGWELGPLLFTTTLSGHGTADLTLDAWHCSPITDCEISPPYEPVALSYNFAASDTEVPEPGTLALVLGGGAAMLGGARRRRRASR